MVRQETLWNHRSKWGISPILQGPYLFNRMI